MTASIYIGDTTEFEATIKDEDGAIVDVSLASSLELVFNGPTGTAVVKTASKKTDGSDGKITYTTSTTDLATAGKWLVQGFVVVAGRTFHSDIHEFWVWENLRRA